MSRFTRIADSYRARLIVGYVLVAAVFSLAWGWSLYGPLQQTALQQQQRNLTAVARAAGLYAAALRRTTEVHAARPVVPLSDRRAGVRK